MGKGEPEDGETLGEGRRGKIGRWGGKGSEIQMRIKKRNKRRYGER